MATKKDPLKGLCTYDLAWMGKCKYPEAKRGSHRCKKHAEEICSVKGCGRPAERQCDATIGPMVCGFPLCDWCNDGDGMEHKHQRRSDKPPIGTPDVGRFGFTSAYPLELVGTMDMECEAYPIKDADGLIVAWAQTYEHGEELVACLNFVASRSEYGLPMRLFGPKIAVHFSIANLDAISKIKLPEK